MLKKLKSSLVFICLISLLTGCVNQNQEVTSDQEITVAATSIAVTEILDQLNIPAKQVVGIPQSDSYTVPKKYQKTTKIGNAMTPDMEKISTLKPDLILSPNSLESDLSSKYEKIKISSSFLNLKNLSGMYKSIEELGKLFNKEKQAKKLVDEYVDYMVSFREKYQNNVSPRVLILMGLPGGSYVVATESSYVGDLVKLAGGTNKYGYGNWEDFVNLIVEDILKRDFYQELDTYQNDLLVIHGTKDTTVPYEISNKYMKLFHKGTKFISIEDGNHNFDKLSDIKQVLKLTLDFFE